MDAQLWNEQVRRFAPPFGAFLQSWEWGEFQRSMGREIERFFVEEEAGTLLAQGIEMHLPGRQVYWYFPKGPLGTLPFDRKIEIIRERLGSAMFLRLEPQEEVPFPKVSDIQPATTRIIDLRKSEEALFEEMKSKTRYNIRLGERQGVECRMVGKEHFDDFCRLMEQTAVRDRFAAHSCEHYQTMLSSLQGGEVESFLAMAFFEGRPLAGNLCIDFGGARTYLHGGTSNLHRNIRAQFALHAFLFHDAKERGNKTFDFWGIAPVDASENHPWAGISRYKEGYGGTVVSMPGTYDLPMKHLWYSLYGIGKRIKHLG
ncbi:MAG: peptidoglycan bridge formation glycyltransferase FemA/FemB family protein [Patescibacteria group bacterium]|jgi:lipid II:glycine glycyltransferase (peptidoglycan interpeptide bridge formation enzyme)